MARLILDTNILIDFLKGVPEARDYVLDPAGADISVISWIEVMSGVRSDEEAGVRELLDGLRVLQLTSRVAQEAASIRQSRRLKLPDAVILATARLAGATLVTRNSKDFAATEHGVLVPYILQ